MNGINMWRKLLNTTRLPANHLTIAKMTKTTGNELVNEEIIKTILKNKFPGAKSIIVEDASHGCGAMFNIFVEAEEFKRLSIAKQHKEIYAALDVQIKQIHGLHITTKVPK